MTGGAGRRRELCKEKRQRSNYDFSILACCVSACKFASLTQPECKWRGTQTPADRSTLFKWLLSPFLTSKSLFDEADKLRVAHHNQELLRADSEFALQPLRAERSSLGQSSDPGMGRTKKAGAGADTGPPSTKKARTSAGAAAAAAAGAVQPARRRQQQGIEAALAAQRTRVTTDLLLEQKQPHDELEHRLTDELNSNRDKYLQAWADKCHGLRNEAAGGSKMRGGTLRARRAAAAASSLNQEQTDLDQAGEASAGSQRRSSHICPPQPWVVW